MQRLVASHTMLRKRDYFFYIYVLCMCLYIFNRADISWLSVVPETVTSFIILIISFLKIANSSGSILFRRLPIVVFLLFYCMMSVLVWNDNGIISIVLSMALFLSMVSIMILPISEKRYLLAAVTNCFVVILLVSIPVWILYLAGVSLPHSGIVYHSNGFHVYYDYYFFRVSAKGLSLFPRFCSVFLEPGQLATPCAFLWILNGANFKWKNIVLLTGIVLSFSLISFGLVLSGFVVSRLYDSSQYGYVKSVLALTIVIGISFYFSQNESSEDPVSSLIVSRLSYDDEKIISGNNRTTKYFDDKFDVLMKSSDKYWGISQQLRKHEDWTYNCSGYKKFIVHRGIVGFATFLTFIFLLFWYNRCFSSFVFLIIILAGFFVRDLLQSPLWLSIAILGFYILNSSAKLNKYHLQNKTI